MSTKRMLIDASHPEETRVVIADGNRLEELDVESEQRRQLKGNIYLAKVTRVEPSLQACFVDYGGNRHGFLAFSEIHPDYYQIPVADREALVAEHREQEASDDEDAVEDGGDGPVETVGGDEEEEIPVRRPVNLRRQYKIQEVIKRRQILLIQVVKEERGNKGAALTTYLSLAGRYCVLMPNTARGGGISRKISNGADRKRLKKILADLEIPQGIAVIVRTAGSKRTKAEIKRDYDYLFRLWSEVREKTLQSIAPCVVHEEGDVVKRAIRDLYTKDIDEIIIEGAEAYRTAKNFMKLLIPSHAKKVQPHAEGSVPVFQQFQIESQLDAMHVPEVQLKSGGYIVINPTEALVSIDVNSGRATKERNIEETALKTNIEAAEEIARQLRLRDQAGLIVIDFIDMEVNRNQAKVERALKDAMRSDRARIQIGRISPFGLLELSRQRLRPSLHETSFEQCPHCGGTGNRRSTESTALQMLRVLGEEAQRGRSTGLILHTPTAVALYLFNNKRTAIADIETRYDVSIRIESDDSLIPPDCRLDRVKADGGVETAVDAQSASEDDSADDDGKRRRRRRPRRRKRGGDESEQVEQTETAATGDEANADDGGEEDDEKQAAQSADEGTDGDEPRPKRRRRGRRGGRRRRRPEEAETTEQDAAETDATAKETDPEDGEESSSADAPEPSDTKAAEGTPEEEREAKPRKPRARRGRRAKKPADTTVETDAIADDAAADDESADASETTSSSDTADTEDSKPPAKPRRRRRTKKAEADAPTDAVSTPETPSNDGAEPAAPSVSVAATANVESVEAASSAIVVDTATTETTDEGTKPVVIEVGQDAKASGGRKGWWNRLTE